MNEHRSVYTCPLCSMQEVGRMSLRRHMEKRHAAQLPELERESLLASIRSTPLTLTASMCPFCDKWDTDRLRDVKALPNPDPKILHGSPLVTEKLFVKHVGQHLEQLSLFALPRVYEDEEAPARDPDSAKSSESGSTSVCMPITLLKI